MVMVTIFLDLKGMLNQDLIFQSDKGDWAEKPDIWTTWWMKYRG